MMISAEDDHGLTPFECLVRHHVDQVKNGGETDESLLQCYQILMERNTSVRLKSFNGKNFTEVFTESILLNGE